MKNSPENILKKMYTDVPRSWFNDCGFTVETSLDLTHVAPIQVIPLTGNTTVKLDLTQYLQTDGTPLPLYKGMRVSTNLYFYPQRLATRGFYGNNIVEATTLENLTLPCIQLTSGERLGANAVLRGSLLNRLGVAPFVCWCGDSADGPYEFIRPLNPNHLVKGQNELVTTSIYNGKLPSVNGAVVAGYYDICRNYYANKLEDFVPFLLSTYSISNVNDSSLRSLDVETFGQMHTLKYFGEAINHLRGVLNSEDDYMPSDYLECFGGGDISMFRFSGVSLTEEVQMDDIPAEVGYLTNSLNNVFSSCGLWPTRLDDHFQTMFFKPEDIASITTGISLGGNVQSYRMAEAKYVTYLKSILKGKTAEDWIDAQFGSRVKFADKPIYVGGDSFLVTYQQIVASAKGEGVELGDTASRGVGGSKDAYDENGKKVNKTITFTTQEPGYLFAITHCVPSVSYVDVTERFHKYTTLADFPFPAWSAKTFDDLKVSDFVTTLNPSYDDAVVGSQPYGFDHMTGFNRASVRFASTDKGSVFVRNYDIENVGLDADFLRYMRSVYVEPESFDQNFYNLAKFGSQNFKLITHFDLRKCMPLSKQVTKYQL